MGRRSHRLRSISVFAGFRHAQQQDSRASPAGSGILRTMHHLHGDGDLAAVMRARWWWSGLVHARNVHPWALHSTCR
jgi:hypothetical protein